MKKTLTLLFITCFFAMCCKAQNGKFYNSDKHISSSIVNGICQDVQGRIWIGTRNGLNMFDGYQFHIIKRDKDTHRESPNDFITSITATTDGKIVVGQNSSIQLYYNDRFHDVKISYNGKNISCYVNSIYETKDNSILVGTSGYGVLKIGKDGTARQMTQFGHEADFTRKIKEDRDGRIWILTQDKGVLSYTGNKKHTYNIEDIQSYSLTDICQDKNGDIYVSSMGNGLYKLNKKTSTFKHIATIGNIPIATLYVNKNGTIYIGTNGMGLLFYNPKTNIVTPNYYYSNEVNLNKAKVYSILEDKSGNIWMGLLQKGVFMQPVRNSGFEYIGYRMGATNPIGDACVMCVKYLKDGTLCVSTDNNGLYLLDKKGQLISHFSPTESSSSVPYTILGIAESSDGRLWVGSYFNGCGWIERNTGVYHRLPFTKGKACSVFDIAIDRYDNLWIGTMGDGLKKYNLKNEQLTEYRNTTGKTHGLANEYITQLSLSDRHDRIYIGTSTGLSCLDFKRNNWSNVLGNNQILNDKAVSSMREAQNGSLWVGTVDGIYNINLKTHNIKGYTTDNGLADNNISAVELDKRGRVWISTGHGMSCLTPQNGNITNYYVSEGLQNNEFSDGVSLLATNGNIIFGGIGGITIFNPNTVIQKEKKPSIYITNFNVSGETVVAGMKSGGYTITACAVMDAEKFDLNYQDNSFTIYLSTLCYDHPERINYLYSINGEPWVKLENGKNEITFSHLPSGSYDFKVKAVDNEVESDVKVFTVVIHPAWYFSTFAKLFYFILLVFAFMQYMKFRKKKEQDRLRLQEHIHAQNLSEAKLRFFMNISHEIRTPMTLIIAPLLALMKEDNDSHRHGIYETIKRNSERILHLINQMMDLRKIDKGMMVMRMEETNIIDFASEIYNLFLQQAKTKDINFTFKHDCDNIPVWIDRSNFDKILMNVLSNAFKYTHAGGNVEMKILQDDKHISIHIYDDGENIPEDKLQKIFERFYQTSSITNDRQAGTGIGLDLTRSLVELHHGTITAHNNAEKGCTFVVTIPKGNAHLTPEEMEPIKQSDSSALYGIDEIMNSDEELAQEIQQPIFTNKKRPTIVVVEDDLEIRTYLKNELSNEYNIIECNNGKEGLAVILKNIPSLVISDIMMPEMDGNTMCAKVKNNVNTNHIPVILLTAKSRDEDELEGLEFGADSYIIKPFNMNILKRTIQNLLSTRNILLNKYTGKESQEDKVEEVIVKSPDEKLLERVMTVINRHMSDSALSVDMIASEVGISRVHLHRKMKELTNQTPHEFIRNVRLKQAANLLATQHQNVTEVMYACGFSNSASFSTIFKSVYGVSPREYMKEHLQSINSAE